MEKKNSFALETVSVRLVKDSPIYSDYEIHSPEDAIRLLGDTLSQMDREIVCVINLKANGVPINCNFASVGAINYSMAHPREMLKAAILSNAAQVILVHNHPSSNLVPSKDDIRMTDRMQKVCELVGIPLIDHVIVGGDNSRYFSFKEKGMVNQPTINYCNDYNQLEWKKGISVAEEGRRR